MSEMNAGQGSSAGENEWRVHSCQSIEDAHLKVVEATV